MFEEEAVNSKLKPQEALAIAIVLLALVSGCASKTEAASNAPENPLLQFRPAAQQAAQLRVVSQQVEVGGVVGAQVRLENVNNLYGIEMYLSFDASLVQVQDDDPSRGGVQIGAGDLPQPDFTVRNEADNASGRLEYAVVQLAPRPAASGSGVVATIHLRGLRVGTSPIRFTDVKLASPEGDEIVVTLQEGEIVVVGEPVPTTPSDTPAPTTPSDTPAPTTPSDTPSPTMTMAPTSAGPTAQPTAAPTSTPAPAPAVAQPTTSQCAALYVVRTKDTAFSIARRFGVSLADLAAANNLASASKIKIGQLLILPGVPGPSSATHVVQRGDTLYSIARRYGTSVETIAALNQLPHPWHAPLGRTLTLCLP
jgi:LysM repeat protein